MDVMPKQTDPEPGDYLNPYFNHLLQVLVACDK